MPWTFRLLLVGTVVLFFLYPGMAQTPDQVNPASPPKDYNWEDLAKKKDLDEQALALLRKHKFVITDESRKQIFTPYLGGDVPVFITTDSLLNGYHVLFEESIYRLEVANARKLPGILDGLSKNLDHASQSFKGEAALLKAAQKRAQIFLAVSRNLLDAKALPDDPEVGKLVQDEVKRVVAARTIEKPAWLGPPDEGFKALDYARFQPRGFYTKSPVLERYFRAVSWLQAIPFRLDNDEELAAFFLLHRALQDDHGKIDPANERYWTVFSAFLGSGDDFDLLAAEAHPKEISKEGLAAVRGSYRNRAAKYGQAEINDQVRFLPTQPDGKLEIGFRFLPAYRLPDAVLFQRTMKAELGERPFPNGLEICALLGSPFARKQIRKEYPKVFKELERSAPLFKNDNLYAQYLRCLRLLLERTEPDAPKFLHEEAWQIKTCQTALGSWAQMRHTWALQAKQGAQFLSGSYCPAGFIEPVPEFYGEMEKLVNATRAQLDKAGALAPTEPKELLEELKAAKAIVEKLRKDKRGLDSLTAEERSLLAQYDPRLNKEEKAEQGSAAEKELDDLDRMLAYYQFAFAHADEDKGQAALSMLGMDTDIASKWASLTRLCHRLEILSHKQLRQVPFNDEEDRFLRDYGKQLADIMFYGGNSYGFPRDDAPRVVDVFSNPTVGKRLVVGTGRARVMWVLYPVKGVDVLCRGAVLPYYEFTQPKPLTDAAWKTLLDSPQRPPSPEWVRSVMSNKKEKQEKDK